MISEPSFNARFANAVGRSATDGGDSRRRLTLGGTWANRLGT
jgi:hypothetical protein